MATVNRQQLPAPRRPVSWEFIPKENRCGTKDKWGKQGKYRILLECGHTVVRNRNIGVPSGQPCNCPQCAREAEQGENTWLT